jgi:hypothetical protein
MRPSTNRLGVRTERHPDPDLACPSGDGARQHTIRSHEGERERAPALMPGDTAIYSVRTRLERDIWMATLR